MRLAPLVVVALCAGTAAAAPLASVSADVDGDGAADAVELDAAGVLHVRAAKAAGDVALGVQGTHAEVSVGPVAGKPAIAVDVVTARGERGFVLVHDRAAWRIAWQDALGSIDLDQEYSFELAGTPAGVLRYQTRFGVARCDKKPAYLFAEAFDGAKFQRVRALPADVDPNAAKLAIKAVTTTADPPLVYQARWVSAERGAGDASALSLPSELDDGDVATAWHGDPATDGDGQFVTFQARVDRPAHQLRIVAGDHASAAALQRAARPRQLAIVTATGAWRVDLPDAARDSLQTAYEVDLPSNVGGCVTVVVASTYAGAQPIAISELALYADGEGPEMLAHDIATDATGAKSEAGVLARKGATAVPAIDHELASTTDSGARERLVDVLVNIHDAAVTPLLAHAAASGWVDGDQALRVARALADQHAVRELRDIALHAQVVGMRLAAAGALDGSTTDGAAALIELAGVEPHTLRKLVIDRLAGAPVGALVTAARSAPAPAASGDLWRAAVRAAKAAPEADRAAALQAMRDALASAPDYERRYRLVDAIATLGDASDLVILATTIAKLEPAEATALREVAALAIGSAPRAAALDFVMQLASDPDPGVRLTAIAALMQPTDQAWGAASFDRIDRSLAAELSARSLAGRPRPRRAGARPQLQAHERVAAARDRRDRRRRPVRARRGADRARRLQGDRRRRPAREGVRRRQAPARAAHARDRPRRPARRPRARRQARGALPELARQRAPEQGRGHARDGGRQRDWPARRARRGQCARGRARRQRVSRDRRRRRSRPRHARQGVPGVGQGEARRPRPQRRPAGPPARAPRARYLREMISDERAKRATSPWINGRRPGRPESRAPRGPRRTAAPCRSPRSRRRP